MRLSALISALNSAAASTQADPVVLFRDETGEGRHVKGGIIVSTPIGQYLILSPIKLDQDGGF